MKARLRCTLAAGCLLSALAAPVCRAQGGEAGWISYRDAYRTMVAFAKYGAAKSFLQMHYQVAPNDPEQPLDGVRLTLSGRSTQLNLPLDVTGRTVLPLLKAAYDENAMLVLNRRVSAFTFGPRLSIVARVDGIYEGTDLRAACDQALQYMRYVDASYQGRHCAGVRFAFVPASEAEVRIRDPLRDATLPPMEGAAFEGDANAAFRVMLYRFAEWPERALVISQNVPVAITPLIE
ncbi:hypothetical protein IP91_04424 [Pseudoduganella lurida]|uniref:DUF2987 domain-containing protein n=1 Tax=Pseudoduganella lurida TaxID=1036180 RepID=A0A562R0B7_9BURK|nr:hypothetical protein [Pseudoduganella lurida]TWI61826.1 hypothetical protein IP91_04424 [Pseudoduganella lurida]